MIQFVNSVGAVPDFSEAKLILIDKIHIRGIGKISDDYIVPRRPGRDIQGDQK